LDRLKRQGVPVREISTSELVAASVGFQDDVLNGRIRHRDQPALNAAVAAADVRPVGESWVFSGRASKDDITPLLAVTLAAAGARSGVRPSKKPVFAF
jgi:hypothetical protein